MLRIGIDTGGTFTDFVVFDGESLSVFKLPSTPNEPHLAVLEGVVRSGGDREGFLLQHGSTVATNAFLERKGAKCVLVTNQGFEDILEIGRQNRPELYRLGSSRPEPLVPERQRIGIKERTLWDGSSLIPLEQKSLEWLKTKIQQLKPEAIAVVLLYSYLNPASENRIGQILADFDLPISLSHRVIPEFREFERTSTTVINAYVQPIMSKYLAALRENELVQKGSLTIMQSNGGSISPSWAEQEPVRTLFSGPAGGVVGAFEVARTAGYEKIITLDMGGTSTDVCLCDGRIETTNENVIGHHPISIQSIGIHSVGAGGGSIAWVDEGGLLKVGPRSAGADPGPLSYGRGTEPTVTDANVFLGRIDPDFFLGGDMKLFPEKIGEALDQLSASLTAVEGRTWATSEIAEGIIRIVNTQMERALRVISLQRGYDTRDFTLVTFGGAGALHACELARALLLPRVLVPVHPGALSAMGILRADVVQDISRTLVLSSEDKGLIPSLEENLVALEDEVASRLTEQGFERSAVEFERSVDTRYLGQSYELNIPFTEDLIARFHERHAQVYGYSNNGLTVEVVNLRVRARARYPMPAIPEFELAGPEPVKEALLQEKVIEGQGPDKPVKFYIRNKLAAGNRFEGPAVVVEYSATTWVPEDFSVTVDRWLNLVIEPRK